jgi:hypothetical protein
MASIPIPKMYWKFPTSLANKKVDLDSDNIMVMLLSSYTVGSTQETAQYVADVLAVATETVGSGYAPGGKSVGAISLTVSGGVTSFACSDVVWANSTLSAAYALFYDATPGSNAVNPVIGFWDFQGTVSTTNGPYSLSMGGTGLITMTAA